jgi:hypothetical protein
VGNGFLLYWKFIEGDDMNRLLDWMADFFGKHPGLLPLIGLLLVIFNLLLQFFPGNWLADSNLFLHVGVIMAILGLLLIRPLG